MKELLKKMHIWMDEYMHRFVTDDEEVMQGIRIKMEHTGYVTAIARELAQHLQLSEHDVQLAEIMGLFHDVGRFRQYSIYKTFNDAQSEDHADLGLKVLAEEMPYMADLSAEDAELVRYAIKYHNKKEIPADAAGKKLLFARLLRDADKLDIYRVLSPFLDPDKADQAPKFIRADASQLISPDFMVAFKEGQQADYHMLKTLGDRKLVRLLWVYDVNFAWTLQKMVERGYIQKVIDHLPEQEGVDVGVKRMWNYIEEKCAAADVI
ncbi:HD domain-containing protein [Selenomonas ruminantium]|uniref:HDIG domain-containing protein n=1 Tax=Selenomonas ruminantium TaxID=971 RepID=A0A1H0MTQ5_SELRU|nr:HD domain-containing protein [Selenomonas ruminantium]SDO83777.1 HDIG domain-containing protein [Selenomonas ruminantium]